MDPRERRRKNANAIPAEEVTIVNDERSTAFAVLFNSVREGVYMGTLGAIGTTTLAANPHLKTILGYPEDAAESLVQPFDISRFVDPASQARLHRKTR